MTKHAYLCTNGHEITSPAPLEKCPCIKRGTPCRGTLKPIGKGSRRVR